MMIIPNAFLSNLVAFQIVTSIAIRVVHSVGRARQSAYIVTFSF